MASYRDTFRLLLKYASKTCQRQASALNVDDLDVKLVGAFLKHLEQERHISVRSRNNRLSAIHAFFAQVCLNDPTLSEPVSYTHLDVYKRQGQNRPVP